MYAIAFDAIISDLKASYAEPYNNAYFEIKMILRLERFYRYCQR